MSIPLREYQREAMEASDTSKSRGVRRQLIAHATGLGKGVLAAHLMHRAQPGRSLFVVHRDELIRQTVDKLALVDPDLPVGVVQGPRNEVDAPVVVASVATLAREQRLAQLGTNFALCIIDEAHHAVAESYQRVLDHVADAELILGLTATPQRGDGRALDCFDEITHSVSILDGIEAGYLADLRGYIAGTDMNLEAVTVRGGDFTEGSLGEEMSRSGAVSQVVDAWQTHASDRMTLAFTPTVATAYEIAEQFTERGVAAEAFDGSTSMTHRRAVLDRFHHRQTQVLINCAVLTEGFDEPAVDCILLARPTRSPLLYQQIVGRAARPYPGKNEALVLDVTGVSGEHELVSLPSLAGLEASEVEEGQSLAEAAEKATSPEVQRRRIKRAKRTRAIDLLSRGKLNWISYDRALLLPAGEHVVLMVPRDDDGDRWAVGVHTKGSGLSVLGEDLPVNYATGIGEDYARECGSLARTNGKWRRQQVSDGQKNALRAAGLPAEKLPAIRDRGHASDLITVINARPALRKLRAATTGMEVTR